MRILDYAKLNEGDPWKRAAYHEAGHAVMCLLLGVGIGAVSIYGDDSGVEGEINFSHVPDSIDSAKINIAGATAEKIFSGLKVSTVNLMSVAPQFSGDYYGLCSDCPKIGYQRRYAVQVDKMISDHWTLVEAIAQQLLEKRVMVGRQLEKLFEEHK